MSKRDNGWEEFGGYMPAKLLKLDQQLSNSKKQISNIFAGISIFINGYTNPPDYKLREIIQEHGGKYCHHYSKDLVTHIIANTLPKSKVDKLTSERIITPGWIMDSINVGRLLEWSDYQLYSERFNSNQNMMKSYTKKDNDKEVDTGALSLSEYYNKSRLHHLSTWATELNLYLQDIKNDDTDEFYTFPGRMEFLEYFDNMSDKTVCVVQEPVLMHIDMDCFFVSVGTRSRPELKDRAVVVTHSSNNQNSGPSKENSMAAIASCSYEARKFGIKNGMLLGKAKALCPNLYTISYNFEEYLEVSKSLYRIIAKFTHDIEVGSCDELYINLLDILKLPNDSTNPQDIKIICPLIFANYVRTIIRDETHCTSSCGIGANLLACKLATKMAKPDGVFWLKNEEIASIIKDFSVRDMPGIGRVLEEKLSHLSIKTFGDLQTMPLLKLQNNFGVKTAKKLFDNCRGRDDRILQVEKQRKSISAEINYGIRLSSIKECENFFRKLSSEISKRLKQAKMKGLSFTLKIMTRHPEANVESAKYLGHGVCDNLSKSVKLSTATNDEEIIFKYAIDLFKEFKKDVKELRGVGFVMQKLLSDIQGSQEPIGNNKIDQFFKKMTNISDLETSENNDDCIILNEAVDGVTRVVEKSFKVRKSHMNKPQNLSESEPKSLHNQLKINQILNKKDSNKELEKTKVYLAKLGKTSLEKLKTAIEEWVKFEDEPLDEDFVLIRDQIVGMVPDSVKNVKELLVTLTNGVSVKKCDNDQRCAWRKCCEEITKTVQQVCYNLYGEFLEMS